MREAASLYGFLMVGGMLAITPGPNMVYVMSRSITQGRRAGLISLAGVMLGYLTYMLGAALGLTAFFLTLPFAARTLSAVGAVYLAYLSWQALRPGGRSPFQLRELPREHSVKLLAMGASTSLLNPKLAMVFLTLLPQFIDHDRGQVLWQSLQLGTVLIVLFALVNGLMALSSGSMARFLLRHPRLMLLQRWLMGCTLLVLAVDMAHQTLG